MPNKYNKPDVTATSQQTNGNLVLASFCYLLLIIYGTLFPLAGWQWDIGGLDVLLNTAWPAELTRSDVIVNLLIYIPWGYMLCQLIIRSLFNDSNHTEAMILATFIGAATCIILEYFQTFLPDRVTSYVDILLNTSGTMLGAAAAVMTGRNTTFSHWFMHIKLKWFVNQPLTNLALLTLLIWALSQLTPLVPSPDIGNLRHGVKLVYYTVLSPSTFNVNQSLIYFLNITALGLLLSIFLNADQPFLKKLSLFIFLILLLKIPIIERQLSLEALVGASVAIIFCALLSSGNSRFQAFSSICLILISYTLAGHTTSNVSEIAQQNMNWIPFAPQMGKISGLIDIVLSIWPFMALACLTLVIKPNGAFLMGLIGLTFVLPLSFYIEWSQQFYNDRYPDITDVLLASITYVISYWRFRKFQYQRPSYNYQPVGRVVE